MLAAAVFACRTPSPRNSSPSTGCTRSCPDDFDFRSAGDDAPTLGPRSFSELTGPQAVPILRDQPLTDLIYTFGTMHPGLVTLHNYPKGLQTFRRPDNGAYMDMAALDILRCRELGVPRYCEFRRLLHLPVPRTFEEVTSNKVWAKELDDVYGGQIEDLDLMAGCMAEDFPEGFAFSDTAFRIFILMASRRLNGDRFFTDDRRGRRRRALRRHAARAVARPACLRAEGRLPDVPDLRVRRGVDDQREGLFRPE